MKSSGRGLAAVAAAVGLTVGALAADTPPPAGVDPVAWVAGHWTQLLAAAAAGLAWRTLARVDRKFDVLFRWKDDVDRVVGVHSQVWGHGDGCGPLWVHHREDGAAAIHFRAADHPGLCERCRKLSGRVLPEEAG